MITPDIAAAIAKAQARALGAQAKAPGAQANAGSAAAASNPKSAAAAAAAAAVAARLSSSFPGAAPKKTTLPAPQQFAAAPQTLPAPSVVAAAPQTLPAPNTVAAAPTPVAAAPNVVPAAITGQISSAPTSSFKRRPDNWPPVSLARFGVLIHGQQATPAIANPSPDRVNPRPNPRPNPSPNAASTLGHGGQLRTLTRGTWP